MYIIIGASSGIGQKVLQNLANEDDILAIYNSKKPKIKNKTKKKIKYLKINLLKKNNYEKIFKKYKNKLKKITCINLAALTLDKMLPNISEEEITKVYDVNVFSNILIAKALLKYMIEDKWGRFIHFTSTKALQGDLGISIYSSSKSSLIGFSNSLAKEYGRYRINSNIISLGYFDSPLWNRLNENKKKELLKEVPSLKIGKIKDIIKTIKYIKNTDYLNGANIKLDGGI